jgi:acetyltransferase
MFNPRSVALVGVKGGEFDPTARDSMARRFLENLRRHGYTGAIHPVNPRYESVGGLHCYPSVADIPGPVDAAVLIVPKARMAESLVDCGAKGVRVATIISSGYAESGAAGRAEEASLVALARSHGIRLLGPNCFGYFNSHARVNLFGSASLLTRPLLAGAIGFVTQSGALAASVVDRAQERGIGFSSVITTGNQADIDNVDCLEALIDDADTRVIALFAEGLTHAVRFRAAMRRAAHLGKPCLVLKTGASAVGRAAALAHTGSLVGDDAVHDAAFRQDGVIRCEDADELFLSAGLLSHHAGGVAAGAGVRTAIISMSGAMGGLLADGAARYGVPLAELSPATCAALGATPGVAGTLNPLDAAMATWAGDFGIVGRLAGILAQDPGVDVVLLAMSGLTYAERLVDDCAASVREAGKVFVPMWGGDHQEMAQAVLRLAVVGVTVFDNTGAVLRALRALGAYRRHQHALREDPPQENAQVVDTGRLEKARALMAAAGPTLTESASKRLLALYGVPMACEEVAADAAGAAASAARIGYPVVLKIHSPDIPHKTEAGGLHLGLRDAGEVEAAFAAVMAAAREHMPGARLDGVLIAPMAPAGIEMIVGAHHDAQFGPVLLAGMGGVLVEVLRDTALRVAPVGRAQALSMLDDLRGRPLFDGVRGQPPADRAAVAQVLLALSTMMLELGDSVAAVDINPLIVHADGRGATVADALVVLRADGAASALPDQI